MNFTKEQRFGIISSAIFLVLFTVMLLFFGFSSPFPPPEEEGIIINFGTEDTGLGKVEPQPSSQPVEQEAIPEPTSTPDPVKSSDNAEDIVTQDFDKTAVIEEEKKKEKEIQEEIKRKQEEEEIERKRLEEVERQKQIEEERIKKEKTQKAINDRAKNAFGGKNKTGDNSGEGETKGAGNQGNPDGDINSKNRDGNPDGTNGISINLSGRSAIHKAIPKEQKPIEGKVIVEITVDQNGNVINATGGMKGSTITGKIYIKAAEEAALKSKFSVNPNVPQQFGTITYVFSY